VVIIIIISSLVYSPVLCVFADAAYPQPPEYLVAMEVTSSSVKLSWNASVDTESTVAVKSYVVQYRRNGSSEDYMEISVWKPEISVVGLDAETSYEFHVLSVNVVGQSRSAASVIITTGHAGFCQFCGLVQGLKNHDSYLNEEKTF